MSLYDIVHKHGTDTYAKMTFLRNTILHAGYRIANEKWQGEIFELEVVDSEGKKGHVLGYEQKVSLAGPGGIFIGEVLEPE